MWGLMANYEDSPIYRPCCMASRYLSGDAWAPLPSCLLNRAQMPPPPRIRAVPARAPKGREGDVLWGHLCPHVPEASSAPPPAGEHLLLVRAVRAGAEIFTPPRGPEGAGRGADHTAIRAKERTVVSNRRHRGRCR